MTRIPAAIAAAAPSPVSSIARQSTGRTPRRSAAARYTSGAGLPCGTSSPATVAWKYLARPLRPRVRSRRSRRLLEATARGTPSKARAATHSAASGNTRKPRSNEAASAASTSGSSASGEGIAASGSTAARWA